MNKGFTLVELLIVIVIVGILVTVAMPKYQAAMERGRAQEGLANLQAASDIINTQYVLDGNSYVRGNSVRDDGFFITTDEMIRAKYFSSPQWLAVGDGSACPQKIRVVRQESGGYVLSACNKDGELKYIECVSNVVKDCQEIGMEADGQGNYRMDFR